MTKPLENLSILVTRTRRQSGSFAKMLRERGARVFEVPTIEIRPLDPEPLDSALARLGSYDWLFFTSVNAVDIFFGRYQARANPSSRLSASDRGCPTPCSCSSHIPDRA